MGFEISLIKNINLRNIAIISDIDNDGYINNGKESSIFLEKANLIYNNGLCNESEFCEIKKYCPHETYIRGGVKMKQGNEEANKNKNRQNEFKQDFERLIKQELERKNLDNNNENRIKVIDIIKKKKEIEIEIKIHKNNISNLKKQNPKEKYQNRESIITNVTTSSGFLAGAVIGAKIGLIGGLYGAVAGGIIGAFAGGFSGAFAGIVINDKIISKEDIRIAKQEIQQKINEENKKIKQLEIDYNKI